MDPLSVSASIAGIISLADIVFRKVIVYTKSAAGAKDYVKRLATEVRQLSALLQNLKLLACELESAGVNTHTKSYTDSKIMSWQETLKKIEHKVGKAEKDLGRSKTTGLLRSLKWPFKEKETEALLDDLNLHQAAITLALSADSVNALLKSLDLQKKTMVVVEQIWNSVEQLEQIYHRFELDEKKRRVIDFFLQVSPQASLEKGINDRAKSTGVWLNKHRAVVNWRTNQNSKIWLSGIAGAGKIVLCAAFIEALLPLCSPSTALGFFHCAHDKPESQSLVNMLSSLVVQVGYQDLAAFEILETYYDELHPKSGLQRPAEVARLFEVAGNMASKFAKVFIVIDGLDECGKSTEQIAKQIGNLFRRSPNISAAVFSRDEVEIREHLTEGFKHIAIDAHKEDLELYVRAEMESRTHLSRFEPDLKREIREGLINRAQGMFRWVSCQLDFLQDVPEANCRQALKDLPLTLPGTYDRILAKYWDNKYARDIVRTALHWICESDGQLTIIQLCEAISFKPDSGSVKAEYPTRPDDIARYCSSLIRRSNDGAHSQLAHFTVREYLCSEHILEQDKLKFFHYDSARVSAHLTAVTLRYVMAKEFRRSSFTIPEVLSVIRQRYEKFAFYSYACTFWPHRHEAHTDPKVSKLLEKLLHVSRKASFRNWLIEFIAIECWGIFNHDRSMTKLIQSALREDMTPLHAAAALLMPAMCQRLLQKGVKVNTTGKFGTPLQCAVIGPSMFIGDEEVGAADSHRFGLTLHYCRLRHQAETLTLLLGHEASVPTTWRHFSMISYLTEVCLKTDDAAPLTVILQHAQTITEHDISSIQNL